MLAHQAYIGPGWRSKPTCWRIRPRVGQVGASGLRIGEAGRARRNGLTCIADKPLHIGHKGFLMVPLSLGRK